ncbi:MAG: O-methyltransferase [Eubacterium sp.]|nr:O-methyltransferase [Eubacterium sp.]
MLQTDRVRSFILSHYADEDGELGRIYEDAVNRGIPVIRQDTKELLRLLLSMQKPERILEIGTAVGFSALFMAECLPDAEIVTMELDPERAREAERNFRERGAGGIRLLEGDAARLLPEMSGTFDFIFVDAAKAQYISYLPELLRLSKEETVILSDNVLQEGNILESHFLVEKRDRTIHDRMREYLWKLTHTPGMDTCILDVGDGVAVTHIKKRV